MELFIDGRRAGDEKPTRTHVRRRSVIEAIRADALDELAVEFRIHINKKGDRLKAITARDGSTFGNTPGPERQKLIASGDVAALRRLDDEERDLVVEMEVLRSLQKRLRTHFDATKTQEFVEAAPVRYSELAKLLAAEAKAQAALLATRKATQSALRDLNTQRPQPPGSCRKTQRRSFQAVEVSTETYVEFQHR